MKNIIYSLSFLMILLLSFTKTNAQSDFANWSSIALKHKVDAKNTLVVKPIIRHSQYFSNYLNLFADITLSHKLNDKWRVKVLNRSIFENGKSYRNWMFFDVSNGQAIGKHFLLLNRVRYHLQMNLNNTRERDFIRYEPQLVFHKMKDFKIHFAIDNFFNVGEDYIYQRSRYQIGFVHNIKPNLAINFNYWLEDFSEKTNLENLPLLYSSLIINIK